jgi:hypothetical protein
MEHMGERSEAMLENLSGYVGYAMHEDRLRQAVTNERRAETGKRHMRRYAHLPRQSCREVVARALVALATRIAYRVLRTPRDARSGATP